MSSWTWYDSTISIQQALIDDDDPLAKRNYGLILQDVSLQYQHLKRSLVTEILVLAMAVDLGKLLRRRYRSDIDLQKIRFNFRIHETHSRNWSASVEYDHGGVVPFVMSFSGKAIDEDVLWDQMSMVYAEWQYPLPNEKTGPS